MLESSAKRMNDNVSDEFGRSFMYIIKRSGPNKDPCGTPHARFLRLESCPFMITNCVLLDR